jgi:hypothetical protein
MPQLVLQADWQEVWHSPHPPFFALSQRLRVFMVLMCFMVTSSVNFFIIRLIITYPFYLVNDKKVKSWPRAHFLLIFGEKSLKLSV